jgi:CheY-like chemotaxis protein
MTAIRPDVPVIVITGYMETARQRLLEKSHVRAILRKPVSREDLARVISRHLRSVR